MSSNLEGDLNEDGIIDEMDRVRGELGGEINQLGEKMKNMFDWQSYVKSAPVTSAAAAVVVGYLLAPRLGSSQTVVQWHNDERPAKPATGGEVGLTGLLSTIVWGAVAHAGSMYLADVLTRQLMGSQGAPGSEPAWTAGDESSYDSGGAL